MTSSESVRRHFDLDAERFDAIYREDKGLVARFVDGVWRGVVQRRFALALERLTPMEDGSVLDVGCGSGRFSVAFARAGATTVLGLDIAPRMIELAQDHAEALGVADRCSFELGEFPGIIASRKFDTTLAFGYFDYVGDPAAHLSAMRDCTRRDLAVSFPKSRDLRAPIRKVRFALSRCPLYLYSRRGVEELMAEAGWANYELVDLGRDYVVFASK